MSERLWSGAGCADSPDFQFVKHSDSGIPLFRKIGDETVHLKTAGGYVHVIKHAAEPAPKRIEKETQMPAKDSVYAAMVTMAKAANPSDTEAAAIDKLLKTDVGSDLYTLHEAAYSVEKAGTTVSKVASDAALESLAKTVQKANPHLSPEQAYCKALTEHPELYEAWN